MAMSATIALSPSSSCVTEQKVTATLTITNSAAYQVNVTSIQGYALPTSASVSNYNSGVSVGVVNNGPNANLAVPANGSLVLTFDLKFHAPSTGTLSNGSNTYSVAALINSDDGSVFAPTAATITVNYVVSYSSAQS